MVDTQVIVVVVRIEDAWSSVISKGRAAGPL
jgi:hypothetical protein